MRAVVYHGPRDLRWETTADPGLEAATDAVVRVRCTSRAGAVPHRRPAHGDHGGRDGLGPAGGRRRRARLRTGRQPRPALRPAPRSGAGDRRGSRAGARAQERGCQVVDPEKGNLVERVLALTGGRGADAVIEAVGRPELVASATLLARAGGRIAVVGVITEPVEVPWALVFLKNLSLHSGLVSPQRHIVCLLALVESGRFDPTELITHRLPLSDAVGAYQMLAERRPDVLKVVFTP